MINIIDEKFIENSISSVSIEGIENILFQMKKCICKIYKKDGNKGTGFFCRIPFPDYNNLLPALITNNHILGQNDIENHNIIDISLNNGQEEKRIKINSKRILFTAQDLDVTIIEIRPNKDNITNFLDIDENIAKENYLLEKLYKNKSIYICHYPKGKNIEVSYGQISSLTDYHINHLCQTENGSSGSPILSLETFKIVGIHKGAASNFKFNIGIFIKNVIKKFHNQFKNEFYKYISNKKKIKNEMTISYNVGDYEYIRIFSKKFVENNKNNCLITINGKKEIELCEYIDKKDLKQDEKILNVTLKEIRTMHDLSYMFFECRRLLFISDISNWNTSNIVNMSYMFGSCLSLSCLPDISNWDTSNVTNMKGMFELCISLSSIPDISKWNMSKVIDISFMFNKCFSLTNLPNISNWDISNIKNISKMLNECIAIKSLPDISGWDTSNISNMNSMFNKCSSLKHLPDISYWNTSNVTDMGCMFNECSSLKDLPNISNWNIINVKNKIFMFNGCKKLSNIPEKFKDQFE